MNFSFKHFELSFVFVDLFQFLKFSFFLVEESSNIFASVEENWETVGHGEDDVLFTVPLEF